MKSLFKFFSTLVLGFTLNVSAGEKITQWSDVQLPENGSEVVLTVAVADLPEAAAITLARAGEDGSERFALRAYWPDNTGQKAFDVSEIAMYGSGREGRFTIDLMPLRRALAEGGTAPDFVVLGLRRLDHAENAEIVRLTALPTVAQQNNNQFEGLVVRSIETLP